MRDLRTSGYEFQKRFPLFAFGQETKNKITVDEFLRKIRSQFCIHRKVYSCQNMILILIQVQLKFKFKFKFKVKAKKLSTSKFQSQKYRLEIITLDM